MFRKIIAVALLVSFVAIATSGLLMFFIERPSFAIQMHPVHKPFGLILTVAACCHVYLNGRSLRNHLRQRSGMIALAALTALLVASYGAFVKNRVPSELAEQMDAAAAQVEARR